MVKREARRYKYEETSLALQLHTEGESHAEIGRRIGRTAGAVGMLLSVWDRYQAGAKPTGISETWKNHFQRYLSSNGHVAKSLRDEVKADVKVVQQIDTSNEATEKLLQAVEANWKKVLDSVADLVEHEAERRTAQETAKLQEELTDLREFKANAQDSNIAGTLRKSLMSLSR